MTEKLLTGMLNINTKQTNHIHCFSSLCRTFLMLHVCLCYKCAYPLQIFTRAKTIATFQIREYMHVVVMILALTNSNVFMRH